jgi:hypothetical protein
MGGYQEANTTSHAYNRHACHGRFPEPVSVTIATYRQHTFQSMPKMVLCVELDFLFSYFHPVASSQPFMSFFRMTASNCSFCVQFSASLSIVTAFNNTSGLLPVELCMNHRICASGVSVDPTYTVSQDVSISNPQIELCTQSCVYAVFRSKVCRRLRINCMQLSGMIFSRTRQRARGRCNLFRVLHGATQEYAFIHLPV